MEIMTIFLTAYCVQSYYIGRALQTLLNKNGDSFLDLELSSNTFPNLFESCWPIYWSPIFNILLLTYWWASVELTGPCICCHTQIPSFGSTLQRSLFSHIQSNCSDLTLTLLSCVTAASVKESNRESWWRMRCYLQ